MPKVLTLDNDKEIDKTIYEWIDSIGIIKDSVLEKTNGVVMFGPDIEWIKDSNFISSDLSKLLLRIQSCKKAESNYYVNFDSSAGNPIFKNENGGYAKISYKDDGYKQ